MSTIPPERTPLSRGEPHQHRQVAESFGADAERYDRARPSYPQAMVDRIIAESPGPDVLEVGCGTGIVARQFQAAGGRVLGVDVDARMADLARRSGLEVEVAKFEGWDAAARGSGRLLCGLPPSAARVAVQLGEAGPGYVLGVVCQGGRRNPGSGRVRRLAAVAVRLGAVLHPGRVVGPGTYSRRPQPASAGQAGNVAGRHRRRHRRGQGGFTMRYTTVVVTAVRTDGT